MLSGFYTIASGILQQERTISVLGNNITNAKTPGFRAARLVSTTFEHEFMARLEKNNSALIGSTAPLRVVSEVPVNFESGSLEETGRPYDMAIDGAGFFVVENGAGARFLTRNGNFDLDDEGYLILRGAGRVLNRGGGPIRLQNADFTVLQNGEIRNAEDDNVGALAVVTVPENTEIQSNPNGTFSIQNMNNVQQAEAPRVAQGWLERTNMDITQEYAMVMEAQRAFQACSTALQIVDRLNQKAATQIASL